MDKAVKKSPFHLCVRVKGVSVTAEMKRATVIKIRNLIYT